MPAPFEASNTFCYRFARYTVLPEIIALPEVQSGESFRLVDLVKQVVDKLLLPEQQSATYLRAQTREPISVLKTIKWYVPFIAKKTEQLVSMGAGVYRMPADTDIDEADVAESALEDGDLEASESDGFIYAFTFPTLITERGVFPIKIGMTSKDVDLRVMRQCKDSAMFENPRILAKWKVAKVGFVESAIHKVLAARGKWREEAPGKEWFDTNVEEVQLVIDFIGALRR